MDNCILCGAEDETVAITAVLDDLDNHLGDDVEEDQMMMVENGDLTVEEVDQPRSLRPCSFVAPPPPDEPPPEDVEIVCYNDIMGVKVDTVDIGTETSDDSASFDQESPKSSTSKCMYLKAAYKIIPINCDQNISVMLASICQLAFMSSASGHLLQHRYIEDQLMIHFHMHV